MNTYLTARVAAAHHDELLRQAKTARLGTLARNGRRQARTAVVVRVLRPDDRREIRRLLRRSSLRSLPAHTLQQFAAIDHVQHEAVGAFIDRTLIGAAHYVVSPGDPTSAEICIEVADDHHHAGIATRLLATLADSARANGVTCFTATALEQNDAILPLARRLNWPVAVQACGRELSLGVCLTHA